MHVAAGLAEGAEERVRRAEGADGVDEHADLDAGAGAFGEGGEELVGDAAGEELVELKVDGVLGAADGLELGGVELLAVAQAGETGGAEGAAGDGGEKTGELRGVERGVEPLGHSVGDGVAEEVQQDAGTVEQDGAGADGGEGAGRGMGARGGSRLWRAGWW